MQEAQDPTIAFIGSSKASERELGLPDRFLTDLVAEGDWSFVIKAHALIEGVVTHLLSHATDARLRLHALKGDRKGQHAIAVNDQWRVCFRFVDGDAYDVEICDYH